MADLGLSASLCYNLAKSYARNGQTGKAMLEYERALLAAGGLVRVIRHHDQYALIKDKKGRSGRVAGSSVESIAMIRAENKNR